MRSTISTFFMSFFILVLISCGGKDKKSPEPGPGIPGKDTTLTGQPGTADSTLAPVRSFIEKGLDKWAGSFTGFTIDSFRMTQTTSFGEEDHKETTDLKEFYELYKPSLGFSPDSSQFIDMYSSGIMLEKKGKKIIASGDADQGVMLYNLGSKAWTRIAFFGPSAGIEEAVWTSPTSFILAGMMVNDNGDKVPLIMLGDVNSKSLRWFESNAVRPKSSKYEPSGMEKLKIDEWE